MPAVWTTRPWRSCAAWRSPGCWPARRTAPWPPACKCTASRWASGWPGTGRRARRGWPARWGRGGRGGDLGPRRFEVVLHIATIARLLDRLGITPQKPTRQAFQRDPVECERWMTEAFPRIVREARRRQAVLVFLDETGVREDQPVGRTWGERGQRPVVR